MTKGIAEDRHQGVVDGLFVQVRQVVVLLVNEVLHRRYGAAIDEALSVELGQISDVGKFTAVQGGHQLGHFLVVRA